MTKSALNTAAGPLLEGRPSPDDLQWLEATYDERALSWAREATQASTKALQASPRFRPLVDELTHINQSVGQVADIGIADARALRLHKTGDHPKGLLQTAAWDGQTIGPWLTVLDVGALSREEGKAFDLHWSMASVSPGGDRCLLALHEAGGDEAELREFDLSTGRFVEGGFALPKSRIVSAWLDDDTLLVGHTADGAPKAPGGWPAEALVWKRGTSVHSAKSVLRMAPQHSLFFPIAAGGSGLGLIAELIDYSTVALHRVSADGDIRRLPLPTTLKLVFGANADHAFVQLSAPATLSGQSLGTDSVIAVPLGDGESGLPVELVYAARDGEVVDTFISFHVTSQAIALPVRSGLELRVDVARRDDGRWRLQRLVAPQTGVSPTIVGAGQGIEGFVIARHGFLMPPVQELVQADGSRVLLEAQPPAFDASKLSVETRRTISRDGQIVDYFVVGPRERAGPVPTLMTGYGTSGVSLTPAYMTTPAGGTYGGTSLKAWLERGGALVVPALRGGGEHGAAWHRAAIREKRQRSYDDFHAVAESILASRYTRSSQLGVFGSSSGGLLAAVVGTQRPDLYGAVVSDVPVTDMLRYLEMGIGPNLMDEFGDPRDPVAAAWLVKYSPYHNIHAGVKYPAFLMTVATTDNRVGPGHARKFVKRLMDAGVSALLLEPEDGGHGVSDTLQRPDVMAMRTAFFMDRLMNPATR